MGKDAHFLFYFLAYLGLLLSFCEKGRSNKMPWSQSKVNQYTNNFNFWVGLQVSWNCLA